ncbi:hypothetical protein F4805DRAFT_458041 [Annulohypoxylon moriforme]|nr:hypothetical protein F4805DRAFT_458041 [Annulohypoxylon moriforme]
MSHYTFPNIFITINDVAIMVQYKTGQSVRYKPVGGPDSNTSESTGRITDVLTKPGVQADRNVQASADEPRYEARISSISSPYFSSYSFRGNYSLHWNLSIQNDNTGKLTTVYEKNILGSA